MVSNSALLVDFFAEHRQRGEMLVLATVVHTEGSTYRKPGAQMLIARNGQVCGLLSGGCAESDLLERANKVFATGSAQIADYDMRGTDDAIWGIGLGCEGAMRILLTRLAATNGYLPFAYVEECLREHRAGAYAFAVTGDATIPLGKTWHSGLADLPPSLATAMHSDQAATITLKDAKVFVAPIALP
ncbi:MAG TPA: XdhC family protein, partial [Steroidobacteraceae bacterium]|nr:XdhC family protein [Steroidobacteraceae bacterium]